MAQIKKLQINEFRNIKYDNIILNGYFNIFYGENGAGKTSLLESIYYLCHGKSFRTSSYTNLITHQSTQFLIYSEVLLKDQIISIGIERQNSGGRRIRLNKDNIRSVAPISEILPAQLISTDSYRFFHDGPKLRRQFMNWGLFHVEPLFFPAWQQVTQILKQRNAALKNNLPKDQVTLWDTDLAKLTDLINKQRKLYVSQIKPLLNSVLSIILHDFDLEIYYEPGWSTESTEFSEALSQSFYRDRAVGYTSIGPHRADLQLYLNGSSAGDILSQGQQKLASYALYLAQGLLLRQLTDKSPIYLIDDMPSELDPEKRTLITSILKSLEAQVFITGITEHELKDLIKLENTSLFHVEHGKTQLKNSNSL